MKEPEVAEKQRQAPCSKFPTHTSLSHGVDHTLCVENQNKETDTVSAEYIESLILLSSQYDGLHASEEEMVDLTEPRYESFCMTNANVP